ncbi:hypothetical protein LSAT2_023093 [Lamellibrachia satsuma]|nr:hypothetical protein LSAT2_023093 [Lamellibrachia satsuma]
MICNVIFNIQCNTTAYFDGTSRTERKDSTGGVVYVRWGRKTCPGNASLLYAGVAGGSYYAHKGGGADYQCLPRDPQWGHHTDGLASGTYIYGAEYQFPTANSPFLKDRCGTGPLWHRTAVAQDRCHSKYGACWVTELRTRAAKCDFKEQNHMIRDNIVFGVRDNALQERLRREADLSLERAVDEQRKKAKCSITPCPAHSHIFMPSEQERKAGNTKLKVNDTPVTFKLDTGAQANVLPVNLYRRIKPNKPLAKDQDSPNSIWRCKDNTNRRDAAKRNLNAVTGRSQLMKFFVTDTADIIILGKDACQSMNLVQRVRIDGVTSHDSKPLTKEDLLTEYRDIFTGTGMFEKGYHIELDSSVPPVIQTPRKVPYAKHTQLKETLDKLERDGIIASVDEPNDWIHNLVITEKRNGSLRICLEQSH